METLTAAYERLLAELAGDMQATAGAIEVTAQEGADTERVASYAADHATDESLSWREWPVLQGNSQIATLRLGFEGGVPLPAPDDPRVTQALMELFVLLGVSGWQHLSFPIIQACKRILAVTEEELQHVILNIHDGPVQKLFAASSQVELMMSRLPALPAKAQPQLEADLSRVAALLQASLNEIKNTLGTMRPPEFRRRPLASVIQGLVIQHETLTGMRVNLEVRGEMPQIGLPVKIALYRIMQEALSNAYRHANVESLDVCLSTEDGWVTLEVIDAGAGFEPPPLEGPSGTEREEHIGLRGMRDRAQLVGGKIRLTSSLGEGTKIEVKVPADD